MDSKNSIDPNNWLKKKRKKERKKKRVKTEKFRGKKVIRRMRIEKIVLKHLALPKIIQTLNFIV